MTSPSRLLRTIRWSITLSLLLAMPARANERCDLGPAGPHDGEYLITCRPEPVSAAEGAAVAASLPPDGGVTELLPAERVKIGALTTVLRFHDRDRVYQVRVIDVPQAWAGLHGRAVLLISRPTLGLLDAGELQALVAHEIGHEYLFARWEAARSKHDEPRLRQVESACDTIAALTLEALGIPLARLVSAIEKLFEYNRARFGVALNAGRYPTPKERRASIRAFGAASAQARVAP